MEIVDDNAAPFFAPASSDILSVLLGRYQQARGHIDHIAGIVTSDMGDTIQFFIRGNADRAGHIPPVDRLFAAPGAIAALNSRYWSEAMNMTDVYAAMPQARRDEWNKSIGDLTTPEFTEDAVRPTIAGLLGDRAKFFGERVDGIFRSLSGDHVTNVPQGFSKRMIIANVTEHSYQSTSKAGLINDLRAVIAKFMGRDEPGWSATGPVIRHARGHRGKWITVDGGALRIRCYAIGTAHLEIHPDMAYRLNQVLAGMYPRAIPAEFRTKPVKKHKEFQMMGRPLPFAVLELLGGLKQARDYTKGVHGRGTWTPIANAVEFPFVSGRSEIAYQEALRVLISIGGVMTNRSDWQFDYDPGEAINEIVASGCVPDVKAHQYFPTPEGIARAAVALADIGPDDTVLEPSAGQGGIADYFPVQHHAICVEVSKLHCDILRAKGFVVVRDDFIVWSTNAPKFNCIVMNPPFSEGRALTHLQAAAKLLKPAGRIVAVLPASLKGKEALPGFAVEWSDVYQGEFAGTSVSTVILKGVAS